MILCARILLLSLLFIPSSWTGIAKRNRAIEEAERLYAETKFEESVRQHLALLDDYGLNDEEVNFDLALSYQNNGQEADAQKTYSALFTSSHEFLPSFAANQIGVLQGREEKYKEALEYFKMALLKNQDNEYARYNYELLSRWLEDKEEDKDEQEKSEEEDKIQPSNYAKRMKAEADALVDQFRFDEALQTMNKALEIDETVSYYEEFINNLGEINEINEK
jgi:tetratricopeptide (TPR) repeat protein